MYQIGQRFKLYENDYQLPEDGEYMLAQVDTFKVAMISLLSGNRWNNPVEVEDVVNITEQEFSKIGQVDSEIERFVLIG